MHLYQKSAKERHIKIVCEAEVAATTFERHDGHSLQRLKSKKLMSEFNKGFGIFYTIARNYIIMGEQFTRDIEFYFYKAFLDLQANVETFIRMLCARAGARACVWFPLFTDFKRFCLAHNKLKKAKSVLLFSIFLTYLY